MATTYLWRVSGRLDHVLRYVENPEKTNRDDLERVLAYAAAQRKTTHTSDENASDKTCWNFGRKPNERRTNMNTSADAAEQVVRMTLNGVEVAARITGKTR